MLRLYFFGLRSLAGALEPWMTQHGGQRHSMTIRLLAFTPRTHRQPWEMLMSVRSSSAGGATAPHPMQTFELSTFGAGALLECEDIPPLEYGGMRVFRTQLA